MSNLRKALELLSAIKWQSADKDNMEFTAKISCYQRDALRDVLAALAEREVLDPDAIADTLIEYPGGAVRALMFHWATEGSDYKEIARDAGFDTRGVFMEDELAEDDPVRVACEEGDEDAPLAKWRPTPPEGWQIGAIDDSEDGPFALFIRRRSATTPTGGRP